MHRQNIYFSEWDNFVKTRSGYWVNFHYDWILRFRGLLHMISYDKLITNPFQELANLAKFLQRPLPDLVIQCIVENMEGHFHRKRDKEGDNNYYTDAQRKLIDSYVVNITGILKQRFKSDVFSLQKQINK